MSELSGNELIELLVHDVIWAATEYGAALVAPIHESIDTGKLKKDSVEATNKLLGAIRSEHNVVIREIQSALDAVNDPYSIPDIFEMEDKIQGIINRELGVCQSCGQPLPEKGVPCNG